MRAIEPHGTWERRNLSRPQQQWEFADESGLLATARFAGQLLEAITDDAGGFDLVYLGFLSKGYTSLDEAKAAAPDFARRVLQRMGELIGDLSSSPSAGSSNEPHRCDD